VRIDLVEADQVIVDRLLVRRVLVLADVDAEHALESACLDVLHQVVDAEIVEAHAVDDGLRRGQAKQTRLRVAWLRTRGDRADLDEAETECRQRLDVRAILVETGGQADGVGEVDAHDLYRLAGRARQQGQQAQPLREVEAGQGQPVRILGIETEQGRSQDGIKHGVRGGGGRLRV